MPAPPRVIKIFQIYRGHLWTFWRPSIQRFGLLHSAVCWFTSSFIYIRLVFSTFFTQWFCHLRILILPGKSMWTDLTSYNAPRKDTYCSLSDLITASSQPLWPDQGLSNLIAASATWLRYQQPNGSLMVTKLRTNRDLFAASLQPPWPHCGLSNLIVASAT